MIYSLVSLNLVRMLPVRDLDRPSGLIRMNVFELGIPTLQVSLLLVDIF
jgi:hypothetical protein